MKECLVSKEVFSWGRGGLRYEKDRCLLEIFQKKLCPVLFCGRGLKLFSARRCTNSKTMH